MLNQVTGTRVRRVSFVRRAATRSHEDPAEPTRVLLWKSEDAATVPRPAETATHAKERRWSKLLDEMSDEIEAMRSDGTPPAVREHHERAYGALHTELVALSDPAAARVLRGDDNPTERPDMTDLLKRAIGRPATEPPASDGLLTLQQIEDEQTRIAPTLSDLYESLTKLRRDPTASPQVKAKVEGAHRELRAHYDHLDGQRGLAELRSSSPLSRPDDAPSPMKKAEELQKSDPGLSSAEAFRQAMRDPAVVSEYLALTGRSPVPSGLSKAEVDHQAQEASVERRADELVKSQGLRPSQAYARALSESGVYSQAA